jgi:hypothetical protein
MHAAAAAAARAAPQLLHRPRGTNTDESPANFTIMHRRHREFKNSYCCYHVAMCRSTLQPLGLRWLPVCFVLWCTSGTATAVAKHSIWACFLPSFASAQSAESKHFLSCRQRGTQSASQLSQVNSSSSCCRASQETPHPFAGLPAAKTNSLPDGSTNMI